MSQIDADVFYAIQAENEKLRAELEHWRNAHNQAALNFQQENRECNKALVELEQVKRERDVAIDYLRGQCRCCKKHLTCLTRRGPHDNCWEWRGLDEE